MTEAGRRPTHAGGTRARVAHTVPGRLRVRIDAPRGQGKLRQLADTLRQMPETDSVRANHAARSVTVTFDPRQISVCVLLDRLHDLGLIALELTDPREWGDLLAEQVVPRAEDPATVPGRLNEELLALSGGRLDLFRVTAALLLLSAGLMVRGALLRGEAIPWLRVLTYLLAAASIWTRHQERPLPQPLP